MKWRITARIIKLYRLAEKFAGLFFMRKKMCRLYGGSKFSNGLCVAGGNIWVSKESEKGKTMSDIKFAVVNVGYEDAHVYSVDLFEDYESAQEFMRKDAQEMNQECENSLMLTDYGDEIVAYDGDGDAYHWVIENTYVH